MLYKGLFSSNPLRKDMTQPQKKYLEIPCIWQNFNDSIPQLVQSIFNIKINITIDSHWFPIYLQATGILQAYKEIWSLDNIVK